MRIGGIELRFGLLLAPMAGYTDAPFRRMCVKHGAEYAVSEMISAKALVYGDKKTRSLARIPEGARAAVQLFGSDERFMAEAARIAEAELGASAIDINMGCPVRKICSAGDGCALMREPLKAGRIIAAVRGATNLPVTVKIRKGWSAAEANAPELAAIAEASGADAVCVHGRTREQMYAPPVDLDIIAAVGRRVSIPVIGNGGIYGAADARRMLDYTGCAGVMVARGALGNPWIFAELAAALAGEALPVITDAQKAADIREHLTLMAALKGEYVAVREARAHLAWYVRGVKNAARIRERANRAQSMEELFGLVDEAFGGSGDT